MARVHLFEFHDHPWFPPALRDLATESLTHFINYTDRYAEIAPLLRQALDQTGATQVLDLCSGGAGPWPTLYSKLTAGDQPLQVLLTDLHPNLQSIASAPLPPGVTYHATPVDATNVPASLPGFRTLFTSFHHFQPATAAAILQDAVTNNVGIAVFEFNRRSLLQCLAMLFIVPLAILAEAVILRPVRPLRLLFTYLIPVMPLIMAWDGFASSIRSYSPDELHALTRQLTTPGYAWTIGRTPGPVKVTYLLGLPQKSGHGA